MSPSQAPLLTLTLNPALDLSFEVPQILAGPKLRTGPVLAEAGGGGINAARMIAALGGRVTALACLGGATGQRVQELLTHQPGLSLRICRIAKETRQSLHVIETVSGKMYRFVLPGPELSRAEVERLVAELRAVLTPGAILVLSGSQPPGVPDTFPQDLAAELPKDSGLVVDTSGSALERLLQSPCPKARPAVLRLDEQEARARFPNHTPAEVARALFDKGVARLVAVAAGADGNVVAGPEGVWACRPPRLEVLSRVGAGDSFVGAFALALARGQGVIAALRLGTAAAAAAVLTPGTALARPEDIARLLPSCTLSPA